MPRPRLPTLPPRRPHAASTLPRRRRNAVLMARLMPPPCRLHSAPTPLHSAAEPPPRRVHASLTAPMQPSSRPYAAVTPLHLAAVTLPPHSCTQLRGDSLRRVDAAPTPPDAAPAPPPRVAGWPGGMRGGRMGGLWYERSYSPKGCLYGGVKNALRKRVGYETWRKVVVVWRKVVMTWRKVVKCWRKKIQSLCV